MGVLVVRNYGRAAATLVALVVAVALAGCGESQSASGEPAGQPGKHSVGASAAEENTPTESTPPQITPERNAVEESMPPVSTTEESTPGASEAAVNTAMPDGTPTPVSRSSEVPAGPADFVSVERHTFGGMCPEGACFTDLVIAADGAWTWESEDGTASGKLAEEEMSLLRSAVARTSLHLAPRGEVACEAFVDGTSTEYKWVTEEGEFGASSCVQRIDPTDPLAVSLDRLAKEIR